MLWGKVVDCQCRILGLKSRFGGLAGLVNVTNVHASARLADLAQTCGSANLKFD